jgi:flagellar motor switch protein FliM
LNICLPASSLEEIFKIFDSKYVKVNRKIDPEQEKRRREQIMESLKDTPLTISAVLGKSEVTLKDLLELQKGDIIPLDTPAGSDSIVLEVEKLKWFTGQIGVKKKNYAVKNRESPLLNYLKKGDCLGANARKASFQYGDRCDR